MNSIERRVQWLSQHTKLISEVSKFNYSLIFTELKNTVLSLESTVLSQRELLTKKEDVEEQLETAQNENSQLINQKEKVQNELESATEYILELEEKVYKANKTSLELLK